MVQLQVRSIYRLIDFALGKTGYTETHEWWYDRTTDPLF